MTLKSQTFTRIEFEEEFRRLYYASIEAKEAYQIWWLFINKDDRLQYGNVMNHYAYFFSLSIRACFVDMLMSLCKIYDDKHGRNLKKFIISSKERKFIKANVIKQSEKLLQEFSPVVSKLHTLRNNYYAHINLDVEVVYKIVGIKPNDFRDIIEATITLLDKIARSISTGKLSFDSQALSTTYRLLEVLKLGIEK